MPGSERLLESGMVSSSRHLLLQRYARLDLGSAQARWIFGGKLCKIWTLPCAKERLCNIPMAGGFFKGPLAVRCHLVLQNHFHWLISANAAIVNNNYGWSDSWQINGSCRIWLGRTAGLVMIVTMRNSWLRFLALACAAALYGGTLAPVWGAQELAQNTVLTQLTVLLGEVGVSVDAARPRGTTQRKSRGPPAGAFSSCAPPAMKASLVSSRCSSYSLLGVPTVTEQNRTLRAALGTA